MDSKERHLLHIPHRDLIGHGHLALFRHQQIVPRAFNRHRPSTYACSNEQDYIYTLVYCMHIPPRVSRTFANGLDMIAHRAYSLCDVLEYCKDNFFVKLEAPAMTLVLMRHDVNRSILAQYIEPTRQHLRCVSH